MILENKGEAFQIKYDNKEFTIPVGKFEVAESLGAYIIFKVSKEGFKDCRVSMVKSGAENAIKPEIAQTETPTPKAPEGSVPDELPEEEKEEVVEDEKEEVVEDEKPEEK